MEISTLTAISPSDGRYRKQCEPLSDYFSEYALIRYRVQVETEYFTALCELPLPQLKSVPSKALTSLRKVVSNFSIQDAQKIKDTEKITNHDVKAVEYFVKEKLKESGLNQYSEFVHFGLTSQDINNTAVPLSVKDFVNKIYLPLMRDLQKRLKSMAGEWKNIPMLARTHGQPASPTRLGKEIMVFAERIDSQLALMAQIPFTGKFGGATGNFNAHHVAFPSTDWKKFADNFLEAKLGLKRQQHTTQVEHYDNLSALFDAMKRINTIFTDLNRDLWAYISLDYFKQKIKKNEVGSSAMPHKVNPIDFENSEGNLGVANALFEHLSAKLPVSRLQRDLTDSTVLRTIGLPFAHTVIALKSLQKGLDKLILNRAAINKDLDENWAVAAEAIQTVLRREGYPKPYEALKALTRKNEKITKDSLHHFINSLKVNEKVKKELKKITPFNYTGI